MIPPQDMALLATPATDFEARMKAVVLAEEGIEAVVTPAGGSGRGAPAHPAPQRAAVWVSRGDLARAQQALARRIEDAAQIEWDGADVGDRADDLPLHRAGRMPLPARLGLAVAIAVLVMAVVCAIIALA
jgi:hypothetical protein